MPRHSHHARPYRALALAHAQTGPAPPTRLHRSRHRHRKNDCRRAITAPCAQPYRAAPCCRLAASSAASFVLWLLRYIAPRIGHACRRTTQVLPSAIRATTHACVRIPTLLSTAAVSSSSSSRDIAICLRTSGIAFVRSFLPGQRPGSRWLSPVGAMEAPRSQERRTRTVWYRRYTAVR